MTDSVGHTESFSAKRSPILCVWLTAILWLLVLRLDCPWTVSCQGMSTVNFKDPAQKLVFFHTHNTCSQHCMTHRLVESICPKWGGGTVFNRIPVKPKRPSSTLFSCI